MFKKASFNLLGNASYTQGNYSSSMNIDTSKMNKMKNNIDKISKKDEEDLEQVEINEAEEKKEQEVQEAQEAQVAQEEIAAKIASNYDQEEFEESGAKADRDLGTWDYRVISDYYVQIPKDKRWKDHPIEEKEIINENVETSANNFSTVETTYSDGTVKVDEYEFGKIARSTITRYSGDPNNPQEGDQKCVQTIVYNADGSYVVTSNTTTWVDKSEDGFGPGWYDDLVFYPLNTRVYEANGEEISIMDKDRESRRNQIIKDTFLK